MPLSPGDLFARIMASNTRDLGTFDALTVQTTGGRMLMATRLSPHRRTHGVVDALPGAIIAPGTKIMVDRLPRRIVFGEHAPLDTTHDDVEDSIDHLTRIYGAGTTAYLRGGDKIFDTIPLAVREIGWVGLVFHIPRVPETFL